MEVNSMGNQRQDIKKMVFILVAGIIVGWLVCFFLVPRKTSMEGERPREPLVSQNSGGGESLRHGYGRATASRLAENESPMEGERPREPEEDDTEERMERRGIITQQSAEEVRQAIIANAELDDTQIEQLDSAIADMNRQMLEVSTKWADMIRETGTLDMDMRLRMQHDINGVSVTFSDKMDAEFPGWRGLSVGQAGENTDLTRLVRVTTAFEPFRKIRSEILRGEMNAKNTETTEIDTEGDE